MLRSKAKIHGKAAQGLDAKTFSRCGENCLVRKTDREYNPKNRRDMRDDTGRSSDVVCRMIAAVS